MYNVLIVDDEPLVRLTLKNMRDWTSDGFFLGYEAAHGRQALEIVQGRQPIDIVILDMAMPVMNGLEFIERVRLLDEKPEILVLSSHHDFSLVRQAFKLGIHDYMLKSEMEPDVILKHLQTMATRLDRSNRPTSHLSPVEHTYLRRQFLKNLLHEPLDHDVADNAHRFDIRLWEQCLYVVVLTVHAFEIVTQRYPDDQRHIFVEHVVNSIAQILAKQPYGEVLGLQDDCYALFLSFDAEPAACVTRVYDILKEIEHSLQNYLDIRISYGISGSGCGFAALPTLFHDAQKQANPESRIIKRTRRYVQDHFRNEELDLQEISAFVEVSKNHLSAQFSKETGEHLRDYIHRVRIEEAQKLLLNTNLKVYEVCYDVGYKNVESFSRAFKKLTGVSPNKYSRNLLESM